MRRTDSHALTGDLGGAQDDMLFPLSRARDRAAADLLLSGLEASGVASALFSPQDELTFASPAFRALFDVQAAHRSFADIVRHCQARIVGPRISGPIDAWIAMAEAKRRSRPQRTFEIDICDGRWFLVNETVLPGGWLWSVFTDITMLKSNERVLQLARDAAQLAAETDPLTGLLNRRAAMERLEAAIRVVPGDCGALSLALIDLDHFKIVNDRYGHATGDQVLRHFAAAGRAQFRGQDVFARIGGEEFLVLMPGTGAAEAARAVERLRRHIRRKETATDTGCRYTMSAGVAEYCGNGAEDFFRRADGALYRAKHLGRDRVEYAA